MYLSYSVLNYVLKLFCLKLCTYAILSYKYVLMLFCLKLCSYVIMSLKQLFCL